MKKAVFYVTNVIKTQNGYQLIGKFFYNHINYMTHEEYNFAYKSLPTDVLKYVDEKINETLAVWVDISHLDFDYDEVVSSGEPYDVKTGFKGIPIPIGVVTEPTEELYDYKFL